MKFNYGLILLMILVVGIVAMALVLAFWNKKEETPSPSAQPSPSPSPSPSARAGVPQASLQITDLVMGTGAGAKAGNVLTVNYVGTLTNGTKFDSSYDQGRPFKFTLGAGQVIAGWDEGLVGMKVGGKRKLVIPPALAYGETGQGPIPPSATLIFEVELLTIESK